MKGAAAAMTVLAATPAPSVPLGRRWRIVATHMAAGMPELGWSVSEALFMPLLLSMQIPQRFMAICWLCSPLAGIFLQPLIGGLSDKHGRRPFIIVFGFTATLGLVATPVCARLPREVGIPAVLIAFGLTDTSHDALVTPARAAMNDYFDAEASEQRCAVSAGAGKMVALLCVIIFSGEAAFCIVASIMACTVVAQMFAPILPPEICHGVGTSEEDSVAASASPGGECSLRAPPGFWLVWALQAAGWLSICVYQFYYTSVWAQEVGSTPGTPAFDAAVRFASALLLGQALVFTAAGLVLPRIVRLLGGELAAVAVALLVFAASLLSFFIGTTVAAAVTLVVINAPFAWLERQPGFDTGDRGWLTGCLNVSLAVAQATIAVGSGPLVEATGGRLIVAFAVAAALDVCAVLGAGLRLLYLRRSRAASLQLLPAPAAR